MSKPDYTAFDAELLRLIANGANRLVVLYAKRPLLEMARQFYFSRSVCGEPEPWSIIDRRLQALRKKGAIRHDGKVWLIVEKGDAA